MEEEQLQALHGRKMRSKAEEGGSSMSRASATHHVPLCTDVRPRTKDGQ